MEKNAEGKATLREQNGRDLSALLQAQQRQFLAFLTARLGSQEAARDLLQAALVKAMERGQTLRDEESAVAWFYRLLRNALVDDYRRRAAERKAIERQTSEALLSERDAASLEAEVCACVHGLAASVKPDYAAIVRAVDVDGEQVSEFAARAGISSGNARVRLHRARVAMAERLLAMCGSCCENGCADCACDEPQAKSSGEV